MIVFDLDGTLADCEHRRHLISNKTQSDWDAFHARCVDDPPIMPIVHVFWALQSSAHRIEIWSGRSESVREQTKRWLARHQCDGVPLRMRPIGDTTPDEVLKERWLKESRVEKVELVFDDRAKVVAMWRRNGIICAQVAPGEF